MEHICQNMYHNICLQCMLSNQQCRPCKFHGLGRQQRRIQCSHHYYCTLSNALLYFYRQCKPPPSRKIQHYKQRIQFHLYCKSHNFQRYLYIICINYPYWDKNYPCMYHIYLFLCTIHSSRRELSILNRLYHREDIQLYKQGSYERWSMICSLPRQWSMACIDPHKGNQYYLQYIQYIDQLLRSSSNEHPIGYMLYRSHHPYKICLHRSSIQNYQNYCYYKLCIPS